ncbi:MAG: hypothetical protein BWY82_01729 [Verrucomicrobia bacterium ADurb.Bin474]|nr:MAG: hypothetical protein BWY82_01729 [Verrucomicrobia bacterium ADurb.Bin474]
MGFFNNESPPIHILAGENVCIQQMRPAHLSSTLASAQSFRIASGPVRTDLNTTRTGIIGSASNDATISRECASTSWSTASP